MNHVSLVGRLSTEPVVKTFSNGGVSVSFSLAVNDGKDANNEDKSQFIPCRVYGPAGKVAADYLAKGHQVGLSGKMVQDVFEQDGKKRYVTYAAINRVDLLAGNKPKEGAPTKGSSAPAPTKTSVSAPVEDDFEMFEISDDDLPF